jgi:hypothetical protein
VLKLMLVNAGPAEGAKADTGAADEAVDMWELFTGQKDTPRTRIDVNAIVDDVR